MNIPMRLVLATITFTLSAITHTAWGQWVPPLDGGNAEDLIAYKGNVYSFITGSGIFKSSDNGINWITDYSIPATDPVRFAVQKGHLIGVASRSTYVTDGNGTWTRISTITTGPRSPVFDIVANDTTLFAITPDAFWKSFDQGAAWTTVKNGIISAATADSVVLLGGGRGSSADQSGKLFLSDDGGATWTVINKGTSAIAQVFIRGTEFYIVTGGAIYKSINHGIDWQAMKTVSPNGKLFVTPTTLFVFDNYKVFVSSDAGLTWTERVYSLPPYVITNFLATDQYIFLTFWGGGIFRTTISADNPWEDVNHGINNHLILDVEMKNDTFYVASDRAFIRASYDNGQTWKQLRDNNNGATRTTQCISYAKPYLYAADYAGVSGGQLLLSPDAGATWVQKNSPTYINTMVTTGAALFAGGGGILKSSDYGDTWVQKGYKPIIPRNIWIDDIHTLIYDSTSKALFAATGSGLYKSKDGGEQWTRLQTFGNVFSVAQVNRGIFITVEGKGVGAKGLYKSLDLGETWQFISPKAGKMVARNSCLFILDGGLFASCDEGETMTDLTGNLPAAANLFDVSSSTIIAGGGFTTGLWRRDLLNAIPPYFIVYSALGSSTVELRKPIFIQYFQELRTLSGTALKQENIVDYIEVKNSSGASMLFSAQLDENAKLITIAIHKTIDKERYAITIKPVKNTGGLLSSQVTKYFTMFFDNPPVLSDIFVSCDQYGGLTLDKSLFTDAFTDDEGVALKKIKFKTLPQHGTLSLWASGALKSVKINEEIGLGDFDSMDYIIEGDYFGGDLWTWNASDGNSYAAADATILVDISSVTGVYEKDFPSSISTFPNPVSDKLTIDLTHFQESNFDISLYSVQGANITSQHFSNNQLSSVEIDFSAFSKGVYILTIDSNNYHLQKKVVK